MDAFTNAAGEFLSERWAQLIVAFLFAGVGALVTTLRNRRKAADRIAWELIATQEAMLARAFPPNGWRESDPRETWMLEPYIRRVDFLKRLAEDSGLSANAISNVRQYETALGGFITTWATAQRRKDGFHDAVAALSNSLKGALRALGRLRKHRKDNVWQAAGTVATAQRASEQALGDVSPTTHGPRLEGVNDLGAGEGQITDQPRSAELGR